MKALKFVNGDLVLDEAAAIPDAEGEARVRVTTSGICNTDLEIVRGYAGFEGTIGHEFVGVVEDSPGRPKLTGRRVVGEINAGCGECEKCRGGDPRHCLTRTVLGIHGRDGCHAEYISLPTENLLIVPDSIPDEEAVFAEPLAAAYGITEQVDVSGDTKLAVIGDGKLGLLCAMALLLKTKDVTLIGRHPEKMSIAGKLGIKTMTTENVGSDMNGAFDIVVEASGNESGFASAADLVRPRGKIVLKSTFAGSPRWEAAKIVVNEITVVGSRCGRFAPAIKLLERGDIPVKLMIEKVYPLSDGIAAMKHAGRKGTMKILLKTGE